MMFQIKLAFISFLSSCSKSLHEMLYLAILSAKISLKKIVCSLTIQKIFSDNK